MSFYFLLKCTVCWSFLDYNSSRSCSRGRGQYQKTQIGPLKFVLGTKNFGLWFWGTITKFISSFISPSLCLLTSSGKQILSSGWKGFLSLATNLFCLLCVNHQICIPCKSITPIIGDIFVFFLPFHCHGHLRGFLSLHCQFYRLTTFPSTLPPELQRWNDKDSCAAIGFEITGHR